MSRDPVMDAVFFRAQLKQAQCVSCHLVITAGADRVLVRPTWDRSAHQLCMPCWRTVLGFVAVGAMQPPLPWTQGDLS